MVDDGNASNEIEVVSACGNDDEIASKLQVTSVSVSLKSFPSELWLTGEIIAIEENPRVLTISEGGSQEFDFSITDMVGEASKEDFIRNLRPRLLEHVSLVLTAAGWDVVIWERGHRPSYLFVSSLKLGDHVVIACLLVEYVLYKKKTCRSGRISMIFGMAC